MRALVGTTFCLLTLFVGGCGFRPIYAESGGVPQALSSFQIETGRGRLAYLLRQELLDDLNARSGEADADYVLRADITERRSGFGVRADNVATRFEVAVTVNYVIERTETGAVVLRDTAEGVSVFDSPNAPYADIATEERARERAVSDAADRMRFDISLHFADLDTAG